jgi:hypothetical protein
MKKIILILVSVLLYSSIALGAGKVDVNREIKVTPIFTAQAITGSASVTSSVINLNNYNPEGYFSIQLTTVGAGSAVKVEYLISLDGVTYTEPASASDIVSGFTPGTNNYSFAPPVCKYMKLKVTETNGANVTSCTLTLAVQ